MSFFDSRDEEKGQGAERTPRRVRWQGSNDDTIGKTVPISALLAKTDEIAIVVSGIVAFPAGFSLSLIVLSAFDPPKEPLQLMDHGPRSAPKGKELHFGIGFADGTKVTNARWPGRMRDEQGPILRHTGGGGGGRRMAQGFWCAPLPPAGQMRFVCAWAARGIAETSYEVDGTAILDAGKSCQPIWPEDIDLTEQPEDAERSGRPHGSWRSYSGGSAIAKPDLPETTR